MIKVMLVASLAANVLGALWIVVERSLRRDAEACEADVRAVCNCVRLGLPMDRRELQMARHLLGDAALRDWREFRKGAAR